MDLIPYVPTPDERVETIFKLISVKKNKKVVDLGSGDGRLVVALAKAGAIAHGFEINEKYVRRSKFNIVKENLQKRAFIYQSDFWLEDLSGYDIVIIYGMITVMEALAQKLEKELKSGAVVVSNGFKLPGWVLWKEEGFIFVYKKLKN